MKDIGIEGVIRGKKPKTTIPDKALPCPLDRVNRQFHAPAPNLLWVSDFTYVATWQGFVYVAFVIDVFARRIVGWRAAARPMPGLFSMHWNRPFINAGRRKTNWFITRTADRNICRSNTPSGWRKPKSRPPSAVSGTYDNAMAETINGLFKAEVIHRRGPVAQLRSRRIRHPRMGRLVQQPPPAGTHRKHPASRSRGKLLRLRSGKGRLIRHGRVTKPNQPPANPVVKIGPAGA
jgi:putative transposase